MSNETFRIRGLDGPTVYEIVMRAAQMSIDRLREYGAALIAAAVFGEIDADNHGKSWGTSAPLDRIEGEIQG